MGGQGAFLYFTIPFMENQGGRGKRDGFFLQRLPEKFLKNSSLLFIDKVPQFCYNNSKQEAGSLMRGRCAEADTPVECIRS